MQTKITFTEARDNAYYAIGEKTFIGESKEVIEQFIKQAIYVYEQTRGSSIGYIIQQKELEKDSWGVPINLKTLNNEMI